MQTPPTKRDRAIAELRFRRLIMRAAGKRKPKRKIPRQTFPSAAMAAQRGRLRAMVTRAGELVRERVSPVLARVEKADQRTDAITAAEIATIIEGIRIAFGKEFSTERVRAIAKSFGDDVNAHNRKEQEKVFSALIGIPPIEPSGLPDLLDHFVADNVRLIKSVPEKYFDEIEGIISRGARSGARIETMSAEIQERLGVSKSRADLIARDQTNKLYGDLTKERQTSTGVTHYVWRTSRDERVRDTHRALEGERIAWSDPPPPGHPGQDYNCRCTAEPDLESLLESLESLGT